MVMLTKWMSPGEAADAVYDVRAPGVCGATNKRRMRCLPEGKIVSCINPECAETWDVQISDGEYEFARRGHHLDCLCGTTHFVTSASIDKMAKHEWGTIPCDCGGKLLLSWSLNYAKMPPESELAAPGEPAEGYSSQWAAVVSIAGNVG